MRLPGIMRERDLGRATLGRSRVRLKQHAPVVPVGTALSGRPPDRTRRAGFPHRAPTLGQRSAKRVVLWFLFRSLSDPLQARERILLALCRGCVSCSGLSLGLGPSLHRLDGSYPRLRRLLRYYDLVRLLDTCFPNLRLVAFLG